MAVKKFNQPTGIYNVNSFYEFLTENKSGTFLEDAVITKDTNASVDGVHYFTIELGDSTFTVYTDSGYTSTDFIVFELANGTSGGAARNISNSAERRYIRIHSAILCGNGLIIRVALIYPSDPRPAYTSYVYIALTLDSDGNLSLIRNAGANDFNMRSNTYSFSAFSYESNIDCTCGANPQYSANLTSIAPLPVISSENSLYLPNAFLSIATQLSGLGLQAITINNSPYITNGIIYIKD